MDGEVTSGGAEIVIDSTEIETFLGGLGDSISDLAPILMQIGAAILSVVALLLLARWGWRALRRFLG